MSYWDNGQLKSDVTYRNDAYEGDYRTYYASGAPYEVRHYVNGHEQGRQQSWTEAGVLYLNYEVRDDRRFGLVNPSPCNTVGDAAAASGPDRVRDAGVRQDVTSGDEPHEAARVESPPSSVLPYYDERTFSPRWSPGTHRVAPFTLTTQTGAPIADTTLRGHAYVASFIYTKCAAICPLLVRQLSRVQQAIAGGSARIVSFSVTPETDTPALLRQIGRAHV